jgi:hypothetical protein
MSSAWHKANPSLFEKEKAEVEAAYPNLHFYIENDLVDVRGTFPIVHGEKVLDRYAIKMELPRDYPKSLPIVRETAGRIPHVSDFHVNPTDGTCCVILPDERWKVWPVGATLLSFLSGPVRNFFLGQRLVQLGEGWPFGQWGHGAEGIREYYTELLGTSEVQVIVKYLECVSAKKIKGHWPCPCGSGDRLRGCHLKMVEDLVVKIPRQVAMTSAMKLKGHLAKEVKT